MNSLNEYNRFNATVVIYCTVKRREDNSSQNIQRTINKDKVLYIFKKIYLKVLKNRLYLTDSRIN